MPLEYIDLVSAALAGVGAAIMILGTLRTARAEGREAKFFFGLAILVGLMFGFGPFFYQPTQPINYFIWVMGAALLASLIGVGFAVMYFQAQRNRSIALQAGAVALIFGIPALALWRMACLTDNSYCLIRSALQ